MPSSAPIRIATRGSALALAQANMVLAQCRASFPQDEFELKVIRTTGDKLQTISLANPNQAVTKGLFTKELEMALLSGEADLAVHSLKDLPTELPEGLQLTAVTRRADVRDVLIYREEPRSDVRPEAASTDTSHLARRGLKPQATLLDFPSGATIATSSTRRQAQILSIRPDLKLVPIRGNVGTRLQKLADQDQLDGLVLALAGITRLSFKIAPPGFLRGDGVPEGLLATILPTEEMLPCVGQAAIGIETRRNDPRLEEICAKLNDPGTQRCVAAERAFLHAMGGGCLSPVAAYAELEGGVLRVRAVSFRDERVRRSEMRAPVQEAVALGIALAKELSR